MTLIQLLLCISLSTSENILYILFLDEGLLINEKQTNNNKNSCVGSRTGVGPRKTTGVIYPSPVAHMHLLPWAVLSTTEMLLYTSSIQVSSPELGQVLREGRL